MAVLCIVDSPVLVLDESGEDNRGEKVLYKGHRCGVESVNGRENVLGGGKGRCREDIHKLFKVRRVGVFGIDFASLTV